MNFDESDIIAVANRLCRKGEMTRAFFFLMSTHETAVRQLLFNKVMINHAIMSSIIQLRSIFPQFLAYVHSLKSHIKFNTSLANMHINLGNAIAEKLIKGFLDVR